VSCAQCLVCSGKGLAYPAKLPSRCAAKEEAEAGHGGRGAGAWRRRRVILTSEDTPRLYNRRLGTPLAPAPPLHQRLQTSESVW